MKIFLVDNINDGHHDVYEKTLGKIKNTVIVNKRFKFESSLKKPLLYLKTRLYYLKSVIEESDEKDIIHFLYIDNLYSLGIFFPKLKGKCIATLHFFPKNKIKVYLLKLFSKRVDKIIVHSEFIKEQCLKSGILNIECINYPCFGSENIRTGTNYFNKGDKIIISCIGGTRYDKGLDILIESFKYIDTTVKDKIVFNISGKEEDIKFTYLYEMAEKYNINLIGKEGYMSEEEYWCNIMKSDIILLPYRKIFGGNSGPMTDGVYFNKFIIGPSGGNIEYLINKYDLGLVFDVENSESLAKILSKILDVDLNKENDYKNNLTVNKFIENHEILYNKIIRIGK